MARRVHDRAEREHVVGVAVAVVDEVDGARAGLGAEDALERGARAERVTGAVDLGSVGAQRRDRARRAGVADALVGRPRQGGAGRGVDRSHPVGVGAVQGGETSADDDPRAVRRRDHRGHGGVRCGRPLQHVAVGGVERREEVPRLTVGAAEEATHVDGASDGRDRAHPRADDGLERGRQRVGGGVEGCEVGPGLTVDGREVTAVVHRRAIGGRPHDVRLAVQLVTERRDAVARGDVVGEGVVGVDLAGPAGGDARRPGPGEVSRDVDRVADDGLAPHHTVDLPGRQPVCAHRQRLAHCGRGLGPGCRYPETESCDADTGQHGSHSHERARPRDAKLWHCPTRPPVTSRGRDIGHRTRDATLVPRIESSMSRRAGDAAGRLTERVTPRDAFDDAGCLDAYAT